MSHEKKLKAIHETEGCRSFDYRNATQCIFQTGIDWCTPNQVGCIVSVESLRGSLHL